MALVIEDGTGKADATSYVTVSELRSFANVRGKLLPAEDTEVEAMLVSAMDFLEAQRSRYQGKKTYPETQALQWPRTGVVIDCDYEVPEDAIPVELKKAQMQAAIEISAGMSLMPSSDGRAIKREKVDVIETEYMTATDLGAGGSMGPSFPALDAFLAPLFEPCGGGFFLKTVRA